MESSINDYFVLGGGGVFFSSLQDRMQEINDEYYECSYEKEWVHFLMFMEDDGCEDDAVNWLKIDS